MESPSHMTPLSQCWKLDCPPPDEAKGKKRAELNKIQLHKFETITKEHKVTAIIVCNSWRLNLGNLVVVLYG